MTNAPEQRKWKVFLVDDHPLVREHLTALLQREQDLQVCGEAGDAPTALSLITRQPPDLVILDISLKHSHGLELLKDLQNLRPSLPVLVLSMHDETLYAERALLAGAMGYITKEEATVSVLSAVRKVLAGQVYLSERMAGRMMQKMVKGAKDQVASPLEVLADRELEAADRRGVTPRYQDSGILQGANQREAPARRRQRTAPVRDPLGAGQGRRLSRQDKPIAGSRNGLVIPPGARIFGLKSAMLERLTAQPRTRATAN
jgi:DNA-binding NarL/FixJ family response regulator